MAQYHTEQKTTTTTGLAQFWYYLYIDDWTSTFQIAFLIVNVLKFYLVPLAVL